MEKLPLTIQVTFSDFHLNCQKITNLHLITYMYVYRYLENIKKHPFIHFMESSRLALSLYEYYIILVWSQNSTCRDTQEIIPLLNRLQLYTHSPPLINDRKYTNKNDSKLFFLYFSHKRHLLTQRLFANYDIRSITVLITFSIHCQ